MACMLHDCGLLRRIDARLLPEEPAEITPGEAVAGMLLQGVGCAPRPRSWTPQVCATTPLERRCRAGGEAPRCQRVQRGRTLDEIPADGGDRWCSARALAVWAQDGLEPRGPHRDTTRWARRGDDGPASAEPASRRTPGEANDHRPDLQPAVVAVSGAHEGGVPRVRHRWEGTASETPMFQARAQARRTAGARAPTPRPLGAEAPRSPEATAAPRATRGVITRRPGPLTRVSPVLSQALRWGPGQARQATPRDHGRAWCHDGRAPRGRVVSSPAALARAEARVTTAPPRAGATRAQPLWPVHAPRVETPEAAPAARAVRATSWREHPGATTWVLAPPALCWPRAADPDPPAHVA